MSNYKIYKDNGSKYCIEFLVGEEKKREQAGFIKSLIDTQILVGASTNVNRNKLFFYADMVTTFANFLQKQKQKQNKDNTVMNIIDCLSKQIFYLEAQGYSFYKLTMESILVIDDCRFIIIDRSLMLNLNNSIPKTIYFDMPINKDGFISPELKNLSVLPSFIPYNSIYYSLGLVVLCYLNGSPLTEGVSLEQDEILNSIIDTKLFGFIKRCLHSNIEKRRLLFI
jgi:hypothetical protein